MGATKTDPIVRHESQYKTSLILTQFKPKDKSTESGTPENIEYDKLLTDGIWYPLIRINSYVLNPDQIISFVLHNDRFLPYIDLVFNDVDGMIHMTDMPSMQNVIAVYISEVLPDVHKPIKLDFYITSCNVINGIFYVQAEFKNDYMQSVPFKQQVFHYPSAGCPAPECGLGPNRRPTTYEFFHVAAEECELGFAATKNTKEINDSRPRLLSSKKYKLVCKEQLDYSGLDEESYFDAWVDTFGSIILVNVAWLFKESVTPPELQTKAIVGVISTEYETQDKTKVVIDCPRLLSNVNRIPSETNLLIDSFERMTDLNAVYNEGTNLKYDIMKLEGAECYGDEAPEMTEPTEQDEEVTEASRSGLNRKYDFPIRKFVGFENNVSIPILGQHFSREKWFREKRQTMFKASMPYINLGIERGMLVAIAWYTENTTLMADISANAETLKEPSSGDPQIKNDNVMDPGDPFEYNQMVLDYETTGIYYIDGIDFVYSDTEGAIRQNLYLIKKGAITQYHDVVNPPRIHQEPKL